MQDHLTVLVIEDEDDAREAVRLVLSLVPGLAATVVEAPTLAEGIARLAELAPDAVLLDLGLPDSQGLATVRRVCMFSPRTAVIVLSGSAELLGPALHEGAQEAVLKGAPESVGEGLVRSIRHAVERHKVRRQWQPVQEAIDSAIETADEALKKTAKGGQS